MRPSRLVAIMVLGVLVSTSTADLAGKPQPVTEPEAAAWLHHVVPLPKQVAITGRVVVAPQQVHIVTADTAPPLVAQAVRELRECLGQPPDGPATQSPVFTITLELGSEAAQALASLKNADQAYRIVPDERSSVLRCVAREPRGLYYAAKTLQQLIRARAEARQVSIPICEVTDWPDIGDRGLWGSDACDHLRWLSDRKMNYMEQIATSRVTEDKRATVALADYKRVMVEHGPTYGINPVPAIVHLEQLYGHGLFNVYPELKGQGGKEGAICYSKPVFIDILADWIVGYATMPGITEVDVWMTENLHGQGGCRCAECAKTDRDMLEARAIVAAWNKAKTRVPDVGLRILTSEETADGNEAVFRELPPEVKIWYYHSLLTYTTGEEPMVLPALVPLAREGRWAGVCFNICAFVAMAQPFTGADFIHYRMREFAKKGMSGLLGYSTPRLGYGLFNVEAVAEWSWNANGRSPREFAFSWAVREGLDDPALFTEWSQTLGPVAWNVYGSDWPAGEQRKALANVARQLKEGKLPELGFVLWGVYRSPWGDIKSAEQLDRDVVAAKHAVTLARRMGVPTYLQESLIVEGYVRSLAALWSLRSIVTPDGIAEADRPTAKRAFRDYIDSLDQARTTLPLWEATVRKEHEANRYTDKAVELLGEMMAEMKATAADLGIQLHE
ncbi:MAG: hypothetical protein JXA69_12225 [Phycisphaerae bacterium]|nr:hypothetical protein [Phycisphaerae bacterium]